MAVRGGGYATSATALRRRGAAGTPAALRCRALLATLGACAALPGQEPPAAPPQEPAASPWVFGHFANVFDGDVEWLVASGGVRYSDPASGLSVRADRAAVLTDRGSTAAAARRAFASDGLPRRGPRRPASRRSLSPAILEARLAAFLGSLRGGSAGAARPGVDLEAVRGIVLEGDVAIVRDGVEVVRAGSVAWSAVDDRAVLRDVTLRLDAGRSVGAVPVLVTVRAPELVRQSGRFVGRDVSVTTSRAGEPTFAVESGEIEVIERPQGFEIHSRDNLLQIGGVPLLPIPDQTWNTADQSNLLLKGVTFGYSGQEGAQVGVEIGSTFNETGGAVHEALTGRSAEEFRGDWRLDVGWIEKRGLPLRPELSYRAGELYEGRARGFLMQDDGPNFREITVDLAGNPIDEPDRTLIHTENRVRFGESTRLDLSLFDASDEAVWSEFYRGDYLEAERPETSLHLRHAEGARIATLTGRFDAAGFSYADDRRLAARSIEELPRATFDWFSIPVAELPFDGRLLATTSTDVAMFRSSPEGDARIRADEDVLRFDQRFELAAPYRIGVVTARPFVEGRYTWYDDTAVGDSDHRGALRAGIDFGTRLQRVFGAGGEDPVRHVIVPTVRFDHAFAVDGASDRYFQFDATDALREGGNVRLGVLQRLETRDVGPFGGIRDFAWLDLAQNVDPDGTRDDDGDGANHTLGLFEFEAILRPFRDPSAWFDMQFVVEGEHDWDESELRTFNNFVQTRTGNVTWLGEYRTDRTENGRIGGGVQTQLRGRWLVAGRTLYDLEQSSFVNYSAGITRIDPDWVLTFTVVYDNVFDDITARIDFEPTFSGLFQRRPRNAIGGADFSPIDHWNY